MKRMMLHARAPPLQLIGKIRRSMLMENRSETSALEKQGKLQSHAIFPSSESLNYVAIQSA